MLQLAVILKKTNDHFRLNLLFLYNFLYKKKICFALKIPENFLNTLIDNHETFLY